MSATMVPKGPLTLPAGVKPKPVSRKSVTTGNLLSPKSPSGSVLVIVAWIDCVPDGPKGHGLSGLGPGIVAGTPGGKAVPRSCLNNGNGSLASPVRFSKTPLRHVDALATPAPRR